MVVVHGAIYAFNGLDVLGDGHKPMGIFEKPWPGYIKMTGGMWRDSAPKSGHGKLHTFSVKFTHQSHPVAAGMGGSFLATDELYHNLVVQPEAKVIAKAYDEPHLGGTGKRRTDTVDRRLRAGQGSVPCPRA